MDLKNIKQVTHGFVRAGEGYFSPDGKSIIFQAEEKDSGNPFYQIFVMDLDTGKYRRVSPGIGDAYSQKIIRDTMPNTSSAPIVVIAPDSFKGSLSAEQVAQSIATGILRARPARL